MLFVRSFLRNKSLKINYKPEEFNSFSGFLFQYILLIEFGFIKICEAPDSLQNFQEQVQTGDLIGVNTTALDNSTPVVDLEVGVDKQYQHYQGLS